MRILFVTARPPWPGFRGDQARPAGWIRHLAESHEIRVVAQRWPGFPKTGVPAREAGLGVESEPVDISRPALAGAVLRAGFGFLSSPRRPAQVELFRHRRFEEAVRHQVERFRPDVAVVLLSRLGHVLPALTGVPTVVDFVDALALNMKHRAALDRRLAPIWRRESRAFRSWDPQVLSRCGLGLVVAERDRRSILSAVPEAERQDATSKLHVLPFGLELPSRPAVEAPDPARPRVILTGNLGYFPTVDGAVWFADRVWPKVHTRFPHAVWQLAGSRPAAALRRVAQRPGVELVENPPAMEPIRRGAAVAVAPLRSGSGTPIKILEAMASGVPVLTTEKGREGLDELPAGAVAVSDDAEGWISALSSLLDDPVIGAGSVQSAWDWLKGRHDVKALCGDLETMLSNLASPG